MSTENAENVQMNVSETTPETTQQKQVDVNTPVNVTLQLLLNFRNIVDVSTSRGTFKSNELTQVHSWAIGLTTCVASDSMSRLYILDNYIIGHLIRRLP